MNFKMDNDSIIVVIRCLVYNHGLYLRECLNGFVMQKTNFRYVAVVHDDCSTDNSASIISEYAEKYPDIIKPIYEKENQYSKHDGSLARIMDAAIAATSAKYVAMCEGDDFWTDPYKLQKQVDFMESHPDYVACFHNAYVQRGWQRGLFNSLIENHYPTTEDIITRRWFIATASLFFRNILTEQDYPEWRKNIANGDYLLELLLAKEGKFYYMDDVMSVYRVEGQGMSAAMNTNKPKMYDGLIYLMTNMKDWYGGYCADSFDKSIANYEQMKQESLTELYYEQHPFARAFRPKTYKRAIKKWLSKFVNR